MDVDKTTQVLLVDDHQLFRDVLATFLTKQDGLEVLGAVGTANEALTLVQETAPDVLVMDIDMPGLLCFDAVKRIRSLEEKVQVLFLSAFVQDRHIDSALRVGASGFVSKNTSPEELLHAIREVAAGRSFFCKVVRSRLVAMPSSGVEVERDTTRVYLLTTRELEVLAYLARGMAKKAIAETMHISTKTVEKHTENLMRKLGIHDRVELARFAIREGIADA